MSQPPREASFYKRLILRVVAGLCALGVSFSVSYFQVYGGKVWVVGVLLAIFLCALALEAATLQTKRQAVVVAGVNACLLHAGFFMVSVSVLALSVCATWFFLLIGLLIGRNRMANSLTVSFSSVAAATIAHSATAATLAFVLVTAPSVSSESLIVSQEQFSRLFSGSSQILGWFGKSEAVQNFFVDKFQLIIKAQLAANPKFQILPESVKDQLVQKALEQSLASQGEREITPAAFERVFSKTLYTFLSSTLQKWRQDFGDAFPVYWGIVAFLVIRSVLWLYQLVVVWVSVGLFELLLAFGFVSIGTTSVTKEVVEF